MHSSVTKNKAIILRREGNSFGFIARELKVSKSTLSFWLKDVPFNHNKIAKAAIHSGQKQLVEAKRSDKILSLLKASEYSYKKVGNISDRDIFMVGVGIYIGEGSKTANFTRIVNSEPKIIKFMIGWLKDNFDVEANNLKLRIHAYPDNDEDEILKFWMKELDLPKTCFYQVYIDRRSGKKRKIYNPLVHGTAHLTVINSDNKKFGTLLHRKILATIDRVLNMRD